MYGFQDDNVPVLSGFANFGLNAGNAKLTKFEWIPNGGKDGEEKEALDIKFMVGEKEISYRRFAVTQAFLKDGTVTTDPASPEVQQAFKDFNAIIVHILGCFATKDRIQQTFATPITDFKAYCQLAMSLLPANFNTIALDIFFQYQNKIGTGNSQTYLELPNKMSQGKWLCVAQDPTPGVSWKEVRIPGKEPALYYISVDANGNAITIVEPNVGAKEKLHLFQRTAWFVASNFATQQKVEGAGNSGSIPAAPVSAPNAAGTTAAGW